MDPNFPLLALKPMHFSNIDDIFILFVQGNVAIVKVLDQPWSFNSFYVFIQLLTYLEAFYFPDRVMLVNAKL